MQTYRTLAAVAFAFTLSSCSSQTNKEGGDKPTLAVEAQPLVIVAGNNEFAIDLYARMAKSGDGSFVVSPYSVMNTLGMAYLGATGETKTGMASAMHLPEPGDLQATVVEPSENVEIHSANRVWLDKSAQIKDGFLNLTKETFHASPEQVDFAGDPTGAASAVNQWVEAQTQGRIRDLIEPDPGYVLVLTNAVYFKGMWLKPFEEELTKDEPFFSSAGEESVVPLMKKTTTIGYFEDEDVQVASLDHEGREFCFMVVLPKARDGLTSIEKGLSVEQLETWTKSAAPSEARVELAKYKTQAKFNLKEFLEHMGMAKAFTGDADFSGISEEKLMIDAVIHDAFLEVDESGTEAAAATAIPIVKSAAPIEEPPPVFRTDHPFLYVLRHRESGSILFLGRFLGPDTPTAKTDR